MSFTELNIYNLRNIYEFKLQFDPAFNIFCGENGSGKTTILEAIYLLATGRSFRSRETSPLINYDKDSFSLFSRLFSQETVSLQKMLSGTTTAKLNKIICQTSSTLARLIPCQIIYQDVFQIIDAGPAVRRQLIDWGLFHVKHTYLSLWQDYRHVLKQRNFLLRQKAAANQFEPWDLSLVDLASKIDSMRAEYVIEWEVIFNKYLGILSNKDCSMKYYRGWDRRETGKNLKEILEESFNSDRQRQYTQYGAHQADIILTSNTKNARQSLSRGQQKIILIALKLSQAEMLGKPCVYLLDDIASELDIHHLDRLILCLGDVCGQKFITTTDTSLSQKIKEMVGAKIVYLTNNEVS